MPSGFSGTRPSEDRARLELLRRKSAQPGDAAAFDLLTAKGKVMLAASRVVPSLAVRWAWFLLPLMELVSRESRRVPAWELA
jgi:hypothetical protein